MIELLWYHSSLHHQVIQGERDSREKATEQFALFAEQILSRMDTQEGASQEEESLKKSMAFSVEQVQDR